MLETALQVLLIIDIDRSHVGSKVVIEGPVASRTKRLVSDGAGGGMAVGNESCRFAE